MIKFIKFFFDNKVNYICPIYLITMLYFVVIKPLWIHEYNSAELAVFFPLVGWIIIYFFAFLQYKKHNLE